MKPGTRIRLQVQEVDTLLMELRCKFIAVLPEAPLSADALSMAAEFVDTAEASQASEMEPATSGDQVAPVGP